jgi:hypothetical protein
MLRRFLSFGALIIIPIVQYGETTMKALKRLALVLLGAAAVGCAPGGAPQPITYDQGVEVMNYTRQTVAITYMVRGSSEERQLGSVAPGKQERFMLPREVVTNVFATRPGGERIESTTDVRIRRFRSDAPAN